MSEMVPSGTLAKAIARYGLSQRDFAALSGVNERTQRAWNKGRADASWGDADAALVALGLHWWDLWPVGSPAGIVAQRLWEGATTLVVACVKCGLEDVRAEPTPREAERKRCSACGGRVRVVVDAVAA